MCTDRAASPPLPRMPTVPFSVFALLASLIGLALSGWIFGGVQHGGIPFEAPHGAAASAAAAPRRMTSFAAGPTEEEGEQGGRSLRKNEREERGKERKGKGGRRKGRKKEREEEGAERGSSQGQGGAADPPRSCLYCPFEQEEGGGGEHKILEFDCASRVKDKPFRKGGAPVQYIHVPKAGGTTIQALLEAMGHTLGCDINYKNSNGKCKAIWGSFGAGVYMGHRPLGWCFAESPARPLYIVSLREPIARIVSLYDYMATFTGKGGGRAFQDSVQHMRVAEREMEGRGIPRTGFLEHLLVGGQMRGLLKDLQMSWLLPGQCSSPRDDPRSRLATALTNLLRCDVVVDSDQLSSQLLPQLWYHAPQTQYLRLITHANAAHRPKQVLSNATITKILEARRVDEVDGVDGDLILYDFARRVARAREDRARACWDAEGGSGRNGVDCSALCAINVTATELELIRNHTDSSEKCDPDLSAKGKAAARARP